MKVVLPSPDSPENSGVTAAAAAAVMTAAEHTLGVMQVWASAYETV